MGPAPEILDLESPPFPPVRVNQLGFGLSVLLAQPGSGILVMGIHLPYKTQRITMQPKELIP